MIKKYLLEKLIWILFFCFLQGIFLVVAYVDSAIKISSILYIVFLSFVLFIVFLVIQYGREVSFYRRLEEWEPNVDVEIIGEGNTPFEQIVEKTIKQQIESTKQELNQLVVEVEQGKDELLSWIHEVKTPLTTMKLMMERIDDNALREQLMYEWLRVHLLLDQQLHKRRLSSMENDLYIEKMDLEKLIIQEIQSLKTWCFQKGLGFDVDLKVFEVLSDAKWLPFIFRQILTNAVKYSGKSDIKVRSYHNNGKVVVEIQDYGRGIEARDIPRIFEKGFTSTSDHKDQNATGMGLYLAKKAAVHLKIHMDVESSYGVGTLFILTFPHKNDFIDLISM
ncbi:sensor histidine kinase [Ornithinibacillus sp. 179-J 7C1 HS]|uniref:sensor histidine kinase n=1 Tax=Ornithinibacillus sp. 179-J 7C1 HS TaxID=3142384 RepID=UPI0039A1CA45